MSNLFYIGTKVVKGVPMSREIYNKYRGWALPENENGADEGYLVEYTDGGPRNDPRHDGYISWSPKDVFEGSYKPTNGMTFGLAVEALRKGRSVARKGWNGKGMYLFLVQGSNNLARVHGYGFGEMVGEPTFADTIFMRTVDNRLVAWTSSQSDILACDWMIVE